MTESDEALERWKRAADEETQQKNARQAFVNEMIDSLYRIKAFDSCPDSESLYEIADLAVRLVHSCHKVGGEGPVLGYGIKGKFLRAVRRHSDNQHKREWKWAGRKHITVRQKLCLEDYNRPEEGRSPVPDERWDRRQMNWALKHGLIRVGPLIGAHVLTERGRSVLASGIIE